jgi:hypothetical protein
MPENKGAPAYTLGTGAAEQERFRGQAEDLRPHSDLLFGRIGVKPGGAPLTLAEARAGTSACWRS